VIEGRATARNVRGSAQKAKLVLDLIRGQDVNTALATLRFCQKRAARHVSKVLRSAVANVQQQEGAGSDIDHLYVGSCYANQGPSMKRIRAAPMGRAFRIIKRTVHLTVTVREREGSLVSTVTPGGPQTENDEKATAGGSARPRRRIKRKGGRKRMIKPGKNSEKATSVTKGDD